MISRQVVEEGLRATIRVLGYIDLDGFEYESTPGCTFRRVAEVLTEEIRKVELETGEAR